jgi:hypothetical protein
VKPHKDSGKAGLINRIFFFAMRTFLSTWPNIPSRFLDQYSLCPCGPQNEGVSRHCQVNAKNCTSVQ